MKKMTNGKRLLIVWSLCGCSLTQAATAGAEDAPVRFRVKESTTAATEESPVPAEPSPSEPSPSEPTPAAPRPISLVEKPAEPVATAPSPAELPAPVPNPTEVPAEAAKPAEKVPEKPAEKTALPKSSRKSVLHIEAVEMSESAPREAAEADEAPAVPHAPENARTERIEQRHPNGALMLEREVVQDSEGNYINHGLWRLWDPKGNLIAEGRCRDNQLHGNWRRLYSGKESQLFSDAPYNEFKGPFLSETTFEDGMQHGTWTISDSQGRKCSEIDFADGHRHGFARWWYPNGRKMQEIPFRSGFVDGEVQLWSPDGKLTHQEVYRAGRKSTTQVEYFSPGVKKAEIQYLQPQLVHQSADDWWKAKLASFDVQGEMQKHGVATYWYPNGQKRMDIEYRDGQLDGESTWWYANGQVAAEGEYQNGKPVSTWVWWHSNGQKAAVGEYAEGVVMGTWSWWFDDGRLKTRVANAAGVAKHEKGAQREPVQNAMKAPDVFTR